MSDDLLRELIGQVQRLGKKVARLEREQIIPRNVEVSAVDPVTSTFTAIIPGADPLEGIVAPPQFLPAVGETVRITLAGAVPLYEPQRINSASETITLNGLEVVDPDPVFGGVPLSETLRQYAEGVPWWGVATTSGPTVGSTEQGYYELVVTLRKGTRYLLHTTAWRVDASAAGQQFLVNIRYTTADGETLPATPSVASTLLDRNFVDIVSSNGVASCPPFNTPLDTAAGTGYVTYRFLVTLSRVVGTGTAFMRSNTVGDVGAMSFTNQGPSTPQTFNVNAGSGGTVTPAPKTYTLERISVWGASWRESGTKYADDGNRYQGVFDSAGNRYSAVGFSDVTTELVGATITRVQVYVNALYWTPNDGGTAVLGIHGHTSEPANVSGFSLFDIKRQAWSTKTGAKWIDLGSAYFNGWKTGSYRGIVFGPAPSTSSEYAGYFEGSGNTRLKITYTR